MIYRFIRKCFFTAMTFFSYNVLNVNSLEYVSMNNQECKIRPEIFNINTNEPLFYLVICNQSMTPMVKYVSLTKLRTQMSKCLI